MQHFFCFNRVALFSFLTVFLINSNGCCYRHDVSSWTWAWEHFKALLRFRCPWSGRRLWWICSQIPKLLADTSHEFLLILSSTNFMIARLEPWFKIRFCLGYRRLGRIHGRLWRNVGLNKNPMRLRLLGRNWGSNPVFFWRWCRPFVSFILSRRGWIVC